MLQKIKLWFVKFFKEIQAISKNCPKDLKW